jgi:hypothetical protein
MDEFHLKISRNIQPNQSTNMELYPQKANICPQRFAEPEVSLRCSQKLTSHLYPELD